MKFGRVRISNIGPVAEGEVDLKKIAVFLGPNNAGKSIVSRLVHALRRLDTPQSLLRPLRRGGGKKVGAGDLSRLYGEAVLFHSALARDDVAARGQKACRLDVSGSSGRPIVGLDFGPVPAACSAYADRLYDPVRARSAQGGSVYIPAGRTGTVQSFADIVRQRLGAAEFALHAALRGLKGDPAGSPGARAPKREDVMPPPAGLPPHMAQFHDLVMRTILGSPSRQFNRSLSRIFGGTIARRPAGGPGRARAVYRDARGHRVPIDSAGSGILAAAPLLAGLHYVERGGILIAEEPEAHVEPSTQLALVDEMVSVSLSKNARLLLTTHSDYVVKKILALVAGRRIRPSDVGMYHFRRDGRGRTRIERVRVDPVGAADQEMFQDALDSLVDDFSA